MTTVGPPISYRDESAWAGLRVLIREKDLLLVCPLAFQDFTRCLLSLLLFPALAPKGQQRHDNQKSIYRSHSLCRAGEGIRYSDVVGLPHEHKVIGCI